MLDDAWRSQASGSIFGLPLVYLAIHAACAQVAYMSSMILLLLYIGSKLEIWNSASQNSQLISSLVSFRVPFPFFH